MLKWDNHKAYYLNREGVWVLGEYVLNKITGMGGDIADEISIDEAAELAALRGGKL